MDDVGLFGFAESIPGQLAMDTDNAGGTMHIIEPIDLDMLSNQAALLEETNDAIHEAAEARTDDEYQLIDGVVALLDEILKGHDGEQHPGRMARLTVEFL